MIRLILLLVLLAPVISAEARSMYCDGRLIRIDDPIWQVGRACPEPFWREHYERVYPLAHERIEVWTLNFGQRRLMRRLVFSNGRLARIESLGYGVAWTPGTRRCTWQELDQAGDTVAEIYARCGEPDHRYDLTPQGFYGYAGPTGDHRERWTYDFGPGQHAREVEFVNGRVQRITSLRR
ncbi:MAG: DUF2845 domain-containing protein [Wenzhouxiangella sp.]